MSQSMSFAAPSYCELGRVSESHMRLANYYNSQAASCFSVNCSNKYRIRFNSRNLQDSSGNSFVNNGMVKLKTRMTVSVQWKIFGMYRRNKVLGAMIMWLQMRLVERVTLTTPAGKYKDTVFVNMVF